MGRDTVSRYFKDLIERGFIVVTKGYFLGPEGIGQSTHYRLTEKAHKSKPATKDFMKWRQSKKQKPRRKSYRFGPKRGFYRVGKPCHIYI